MENSLLLSLCIPTNGISEWVFPVLESIYSQKVPLNQFEVIITDNGSNSEFERKMNEYVLTKKNLKYRKTKAFQFLNQIEAFKLANGEFIRFVNHRTKMLPGTINLLLDFVKENQDIKPGVFFSNGELNLKNLSYYNNFEDYIKALSYYSSWSGGIGIWQSDFRSYVGKLNFDTEFPHMALIFADRKKNNYIIDNRIVMKEIPVDNIAKGKYNLFYAFSVKYLSLLLNLVHEGSISIDTFLYLKKQTKEFIIELYADFIIRKKKNSYDLSDYKKHIGVFYKKEWIRFNALVYLIKRKIVSLQSNKCKG